MKIAWIGTGVMGNSMAGHLIDAGHELFVFNRTKSKTDNLVRRGATLLKEAKEAPLFADVIFTIVGYPKDVEDVYLGENGLIKTAKKGQVFVDMTTSSPTLAQKIEKLGRNITYFGEAGKGQYTKLANQIAIATTMVSVAESLKFAKEVDLDLESFFKTVSTGSGGSFSMTSYAPRILKGDYEPGSFVHHFIKDMKLALEECEKMNIKLPGLETTYKVYNELEEKVRKTNGTQAIAKWYDI